MIGFLARRLIGRAPDGADAEARRAYGTLCGAVGIALNLLLFAGKFLAGLLSGAVSITADAFNNLSDAGSSLVTLLGFRLAAKKPDPDHPFGHGRIEYLAGLGVAVLILLMGFELAKSSLDKIFHPQDVTFSPLVGGILAVSVGVKAYMAVYNRRYGKLLASPALKATAADCLSDTAATLVVLGATVLGAWTGLPVDGYCGLAVALFILRAGVLAVRDTVDPLLGKAPEEDFVGRVEEILHQYPEIVGIHDLVVHDYGPGRCMVSVHAEVPADGDLIAMHDTVDNAERALWEALGCQAVIHMDPIAADDGRVNEMRARMLALLHRIDPRLSLHDFRMVSGPTHTNLIFDVTVPYGFLLSDGELKERVEKEVSLMEGKFFAVITVDHLYI